MLVPMLCSIRLLHCMQVSATPSSRKQRRPLESTQQKKQRLQQAASRKVRSLSAWNVFQRERMGESAALHTNEYSMRVKELSREWKSLSPEEREPYAIQAQHEQQCREELAKTPLALKGEGKSDLEMQVGRKGCQKVSAKRLVVSNNQYHTHGLWDSPTQLGDGCWAKHVLQQYFSMLKFQFRSSTLYCSTVLPSATV